MRAILMALAITAALPGAVYAAMPGTFGNAPPASSSVLTGVPPNSQSPASVVWLTPRGTQVTPGLTVIHRNYLGVSTGMPSANTFGGATSPGVMVGGFPVH